MAIRYIDSAAGGTDDGSSWTNAWTDFSTALNGGAAGDVYYMRNTSSISYGVNKTFTSKGTRSNPCILISVDSSDDSYSKATAKQVYQSSGAITFDFNGHMKCFGVFFSSSAGSRSRIAWDWDDCTVEWGFAYSGLGYLAIGLSTNASLTPQKWKNTKLSTKSNNTALYALVTNSTWSDSNWEFDNIDFDVAAATNMDSHIGLLTYTPGFGKFITKNTDLSLFTDGLIDGTAGVFHCDFKYERCKLGSGVTFVKAGYGANGRGTVSIESCDVGDGYHFSHYGSKFGQIEEDTGIYRDAGAKYDGVNEFSSEVISDSSSYTSFYDPYEALLATFHVDTDDYTTNVTFKVHLARDDSTTAFDDDEVSIRIEYADGADNALGVTWSSRAVPLATPVALDSESVAWTGLTGSFKKMSISKAITIGAAAGNIASGIVRVYLLTHAQSLTYFACPKVEVS